MKPQQARVLLTGAAGGIGQAAAALLVEQGAQLLLAGRSPARLSALARSLASGRPDAVQWHPADLTSEASLQSLAHTAADWGCNVVVHGAGAASFGRLEATPEGELQQVIATNLLAPMRLTQSLLPHLGRLPEAQVIFIGSVLGAIGLPGYSVYGASKAGLRGFAQALRRELAGGAVRVQYLGPRSTRTDFNSAAVEAYNRATGTAMDPPSIVAEALLEMLRSGRAERFLGFPESLGVRLNGLAPTLLDRSFHRHRRSLPAEAQAPLASSLSST